MRWPSMALLAGLLACAAGTGLSQIPGGPARPIPAAPAGAVDLPALWQLALANNPELREAAADVAEARGRHVQAGKYPNSTFTYSEEALGARTAPPGSISLLMTQEIVTAGKRRLDRAVAGQEVRVAAAAQVGKRFEVLTAVRRAYYAYLAAEEAVRVHGENISALETGVKLTRKLVEEAKTLPRADLLRAQSVLAEARVNQARSRIARAAAWRELAAEVGVPGLAPPAAVPDLPERVPAWDEEAVLARVLAAHADLREAALEVERARLEVLRARAEAVPNVQVGGGYVRDELLEGANGAVVTVETPLPLWDRRQGEILAAKARWAWAQAALQATADRWRGGGGCAFAGRERSCRCSRPRPAGRHALVGRQRAPFGGLITGLVLANSRGGEGSSFTVRTPETNLSPQVFCGVRLGTFRFRTPLTPPPALLPTGPRKRTGPF
jgi:outer membrane protein TolC